MSRIPKVLVDKKAIDAAEVHAIVVKTGTTQLDEAEVTVTSALQTPSPMYRMGANLEIKLALGDTIFAGRIVSIPAAPHTGFRQWVVRCHGPKGLVLPRMGDDARIVGTIRSANVQTSSTPKGRLASARLVLDDPEIDSIRFVLGQTKEVKVGAEAMFTGAIEDIERRYVQSGLNRLTLVIVGLVPQASPR